MTYKEWAERSFWPNVIKRKSGCWEWTACTNSGYGALSCAQFGSWLAHRFSWRLHRGKIPKRKDELCVCHKCDNRLCVNPDHLFLGTRADNIADAKRKGRHGTGEKKARRGEAHGMSKLTHYQVLRIREFLSVGVKQSELALQYNITQTCVYRIKKRLAWKHI